MTRYLRTEIWVTLKSNVLQKIKRQNRIYNSLVKILEENVVVDDKYYENDEIEFSYYSISDAIGLVAGYITSVERTIGRLEDAIERAEAEEAAESGD